MIELTNIQATALRGLLYRAKAFSRTVETADHNIAERRDAIIKDCDSSMDMLLRALQNARPHSSDNGFEKP